MSEAKWGVATPYVSTELTCQFVTIVWFYDLQIVLLVSLVVVMATAPHWIKCVMGLMIVEIFQMNAHALKQWAICITMLCKACFRCPMIMVGVVWKRVIYIPMEWGLGFAKESCVCVFH